MKIEQLESRLSQWHWEKYGTTVPDMVRTALKGCEEMGEIAKAILTKDKKNLREEIADVFFILLHLSRGLGVDLMVLASEKLPVIEDRLKKAKGK